MNPFRIRILGLAVLSALAGSALAQSSPQSIEVRAPLPVRTDVQAVCPAIATELPDALANVAREFAEPALVDVTFHLDGRRIVQVRASGGPRAYATAVRRVVRGLECDNGAAGPQLVQLRLRFVDPSASPGQAVALVDTAPERR
jgi:hypothetical protein